MSSTASVNEKGEASRLEFATSALPQVAETSEHVEGNVQLIDGHGEVRLVPSPTQSPLDPLNFNKWRKAGIYTCLIIFSIMSLSIVGGIGALIGTFFGIYLPQGVPADKITRLITWPSLFTGLGNFAFLPMALAFGRRPVFILSSLMLVASSAWAANAGTSFDSHFAARLIQGFSAGATESLLPLIITDMTFVHQRSFAFGVYWVCQSIGSAVFATASSYIAVDLQWPWYYWIFTIFAAIGAIMGILLLPETKFSRPAFAIDGQLTKVDAFGQIVVLSDEEAKAQAVEDDINNAHLVIDDGSPPPSFPFAANLHPMPAPEKNWIRIIAQSYVHMAKALLDPAVIYCLGASSAVLGHNIGISLAFGHILEEYGWATKDTGLMYLGALPAGLVAFFVAGWGGDKINLWLARRNGGLHLPEHRLPVLILPTITTMIFGIAYGFWAQNRNVHWFALFFGYNWVVFFFISVLIITTTYAVEAMSHHAGAALVMVVGGKNIISFGLATAIVPLMNSGDYAKASGILTGVDGAWIMLMGVPLYFLMPKFRAWRAGRGK